MKNLLALVVTMLLLTNLAKAQNNINDYLDSYIGENAEPFVQPLADVFTSNINAGVWDWATIEKDFYFRLKVQGMISFPSESMLTFSGRTSGNFTPKQTITAPTILGSSNSIIIQGTNNSVYVFPGGFDMEQVILGTPQATVGGFLNSEVTVRFLAFPLENDLDKIRFFGIGARHSLSNYFADSPIDFSVGYMYHHTEGGDYLVTDQHLFSAHTGISGKIFSAHAMVGYQTSNSDIDYIYEEGEIRTNVDLNLKNTNPFIMEAGLSARLGPIMANTAISYSNHVAVAAGLGLFF